MTSAEQVPRELRGVVLQTGNIDILLPNSAVVEVVGFKEPSKYNAAPPWILGRIPWRGVTVPLISLAVASETPIETARVHRGRMVMCFMPSGNRRMPYVAFFAIGPPRLARLTPEALLPMQPPPRNPLILHGLILADRETCIPDMDAIERTLLEVTEE